MNDMQDSCPYQIQRHGSLLSEVPQSQDSECLSVQIEVSSKRKINGTHLLLQHSGRQV